MYSLYCSDEFLKPSTDKYRPLTIQEFQSQDHKKEFSKVVSSKEVVDHDIENIEKKKSFGNVIGTDLAGYHFIGDFCFLGISCGGDWEIPIFLIVYIDENDALRSYIPIAGNCFNIDAMSAFGNEEEKITVDFWKKYASKQGGEEMTDEDFGKVNINNVAVCSEWIIKDIKVHFGLNNDQELDVNDKNTELIVYEEKEDNRNNNKTMENLKKNMKKVINDVAPEIDENKANQLLDKLVQVVNEAEIIDDSDNDDDDEPQEQYNIDDNNNNNYKNNEQNYYYCWQTYSPYESYPYYNYGYYYNNG